MNLVSIVSSTSCGISPPRCELPAEREFAVDGPAPGTLYARPSRSPIAGWSGRGEAPFCLATAAPFVAAGCWA